MDNINSIKLGNVYPSYQENGSSLSPLETVDPFFTINIDNVSREKRIENLYKYLNGSIYNSLRYPFTQNYTTSGSYIVTTKRRPSVLYKICKIIVDNSVSLVFGGNHFPKIEVNDNPKCEALIKDLIKELNFNNIFLQAAGWGSVGSVAILVQFINGSVKLKILKTSNLYPIFDPYDSNVLRSVSRRTVIKGYDLIQQGYEEIDAKKRYLVVQKWDCLSEVHYKPVEINSKKNMDDIPLKVDETRTIIHDIGEVPVIWIKNINPYSEDIDGECTFESAIPAQIEMDYQLSQAGRALKYAGDPQLVIQRGNGFIGEIELGQGSSTPLTMGEFEQQNSKIVRSASNAIEIESGGDVKLLEINGDATQAVLEYVKSLRKYALESVHGNRGDSERAGWAQSGKALEILNQPLIWLAERLRVTYGNYGLIKVINLIIKGSKKYPVMIKGKKLSFTDSCYPELRWEDFYVSSAEEKQQKANTIKTYKDANLISTETAIKAISSEFGIKNVQNEVTAINEEQEKFLSEQQSVGAQIKLSEEKNV